MPEESVYYEIGGRRYLRVTACLPFNPPPGMSEEALEPFLAGGATQCGACTPGVAMTASWLLGNRDLLETHRIRELMAGNLCRCTGYDGIVESIASALGADDSGESA